MYDLDIHVSSFIKLVAKYSDNEQLVHIIDMTQIVATDPKLNSAFSASLYDLLLFHMHGSLCLFFLVTVIQRVLSFLVSMKRSFINFRQSSEVSYPFISSNKFTDIYSFDMGSILF